MNNDTIEFGGRLLSETQLDVILGQVANQLSYRVTCQGTQTKKWDCEFGKKMDHPESGVIRYDGALFAFDDNGTHIVGFQTKRLHTLHKDGEWDDVGYRELDLYAMPGHEFGEEDLDIIRATRKVVVSELEKL